ncbi:carboxypeptidase-like regulatory domain-containing protein [Granulicella cerasi]|uniref:Carboxypeptidase-like regulatory domain-containing protein n=1 Tax=Granulicella cerasi TaxID=741063 RepID=A0ABW1Z7I8_9BACT|nr:carboxypeptidase-like regulatory domain-containing protein [Granulicella cerasi]
MTLGSLAQAQDKKEQHGRKWKPLPDLTHIVITVEKGYNGQPLQNAAVIFHATRGGENDGNLEVKTDPDGRAVLDLIEVGSHVTLQIIAPGFATYASEFDADAPNKEMLVKMLRPRAQVSMYENNDGKAATAKPGVQEHVAPKKPTATPAKPAASAPPPVTSTTPSTSTAPATGTQSEPKQ